LFFRERLFVVISPDCLIIDNFPIKKHDTILLVRLQPQKQNTHTQETTQTNQFFAKYILDFFQKTITSNAAKRDMSTVTETCHPKTNDENHRHTMSLNPQPPESPPLSPSIASTTSVTQNTCNNEVLSVQKLNNRAALLDQYQDDDDLTTDLLHAIRSWNLERPSSSCSTTSSICSSTFTSRGGGGLGGGGGGEHAEEDDTTLTTTSTTRNGTPRQPQHSKELKTPCRGNYSAKPSFLTERILEDDDDFCAVYSSPTNPLVATPMLTVNDKCRYMNGEKNGGVPTKEVRLTEQKGGEERNNLVKKSANHATNESDNNECHADENKHGDKSAISRKLNQTTSQSTNPNTPLDCQQQQQQQSTDDKAKEKTALHNLQEIAVEMGLPTSNLDAVLPMVRRLVRVVRIHVPRLEKFVDDVCNVVTEDASSNNNVDDGNQVGNDNREILTTPAQEVVKKNTAKRRRKKQVKNMEVRRKRMSEAVYIIRKKWPKGNNNNGTEEEDAYADENIPMNNMNDNNSKKGPRPALRIMDCNVPEERRNASDMSKGSTVSSNTTPTSAESAFCRAVIEMLANRHQKHVGKVVDDVFLSTNCKRDPLTPNKKKKNIEQALDSIEDLIVYEERCRRIDTIDKIVSDFSRKTSSPSSNKSNPSSTTISPKSPANSESLMNELHNHDPTALRRLILHFAYLFCVPFDEMLERMDSLWHFTNDAAELIRALRKVLGMEETVALSVLTRRIVNALKTRNNIGLDDDDGLVSGRMGGAGGDAGNFQLTSSSNRCFSIVS